MPISTEQQIDATEEQLRLAMLASDIESLDKLISPDLIFTTHFEGDFRFTRVWRLSECNAWRIIAGHVTAVQEQYRSLDEAEA